MPSADIGVATEVKPLILFVARNGLALTKRAIASALAQDVVCDVLLIDNASTDGMMQWAMTKDIATIALSEQKSLAACWNMGIKAAWKSGARQVLCCNTDIIMRPDTLRLLLTEGGSFVSCVSVNSEEQLGEPCDRTIEELRAGKRDRPDFSCFLIRKSLTDAVGWFDEDCWPAFTEDSRFHIRCWRHGIRCICIDLPFLHVGSATIKQCDEGERARIQRGAQKNRETFRRLYGCIPGDTEKYDALFAESTFGADRNTVVA